MIISCKGSPIKGGVGSGGGGDDGARSHDFSKCTSSHPYCLVCHNLWRSTDNNISNYIYCKNCNLSIHSECRAISTKHLACSSSLDATRWELNQLSQSDKLEIIKSIGRLEVNLKHLYDLPCPVGSSIYGIIRHPYYPDTTFNRTADVVVMATGSGSGLGDALFPNRGGLKEMFDINFESSKRALFDVKIEIWKTSFMAVFDSLIATCSVSVFPIMIYADDTSFMERWMSLKGPNGESSGKALLSMRFVATSAKVDKAMFMKITANTASSEEISQILSTDLEVQKPDPAILSNVDNIDKKNNYSIDSNRNSNSNMNSISSSNSNSNNSSNSKEKYHNICNFSSLLSEALNSALKVSTSERIFPVAVLVLKTKRIGDSIKQFINILTDVSAPSLQTILSVVDAMDAIISADQYNLNKFDIKELQTITAAIRSIQKNRSNDTLVCFGGGMETTVDKSGEHTFVCDVVLHPSILDSKGATESRVDVLKRIVASVMELSGVPLDLSEIKVLKISKNYKFSDKSSEIPSFDTNDLYKFCVKRIFGFNLTDKDAAVGNYSILNSDFGSSGTSNSISSSINIKNSSSSAISNNSQVQIQNKIQVTERTNPKEITEFVFSTPTSPINYSRREDAEVAADASTSSYYAGQPSLTSGEKSKSHLCSDISIDAELNKGTGDKINSEVNDGVNDDINDEAASSLNGSETSEGRGRGADLYGSGSDSDVIDTSDLPDILIDDDNGDEDSSDSSGDHFDDSFAEEVKGDNVDQTDYNNNDDKNNNDDNDNIVGDDVDGNNSLEQEVAGLIEYSANLEGSNGKHLSAPASESESDESSFHKLATNVINFFSSNQQQQLQQLDSTSKPSSQQVKQSATPLKPSNSIEGACIDKEEDSVHAITTADLSSLQKGDNNVDKCEASAISYNTPTRIKTELNKATTDDILSMKKLADVPAISINEEAITPNGTALTTDYINSYLSGIVSSVIKEKWERNQDKYDAVDLLVSSNSNSSGSSMNSNTIGNNRAASFGDNPRSRANSSEITGRRNSNTSFIYTSNGSVHDMNALEYSSYSGNHSTVGGGFSGEFNKDICTSTSSSSDDECKSVAVSNSSNSFAVRPLPLSLDNSGDQESSHSLDAINESPNNSDNSAVKIKTEEEGEEEEARGEISSRPNEFSLVNPSTWGVSSYFSSVSTFVPTLVSEAQLQLKQLSQSTREVVANSSLTNNSSSNNDAGFISVIADAFSWTGLNERTKTKTMGFKDDPLSVGTIKIGIASVFRQFDKKIENVSSNFDVTSFFSICAIIEDSDQESSTEPKQLLWRNVDSNGEVIRVDFEGHNSIFWTFSVPHFRSVLKLYLSVHNNKGAFKRVGECRVPIMHLIQRDADCFFYSSVSSSSEDSGALEEEPSQSPMDSADSSSNETSSLRTVDSSDELSSLNFRDGSDEDNGSGNSSGSNTERSELVTGNDDTGNAGSNINNIKANSNVNKNTGKTSIPLSNWNITDISNPNTTIGHFRASIDFVEDFGKLYFSADPIVSRKSPPEDLSVERLTIHIARFSEIFALFSHLCDEYVKIIFWDDPVLTCCLLVLFIYACLFINAEYALVCPLFMVVILMSTSLYRRKVGKFKLKWLEPKKMPKELMPDKYQPFSVLRMSVLGFRNLAVNLKSSSFRPNCRISYVCPNLITSRDHDVLVGATATATAAAGGEKGEKSMPISSTAHDHDRSSGSASLHGGSSGNSSSSSSNSNNSGSGGGGHHSASGGGAAKEANISDSATKHGNKVSKPHQQQQHIELFVGCFGSTKLNENNDNNFSKFLQSFIVGKSSKRDMILSNVLDPWTHTEVVHGSEFLKYYLDEVSMVYPILQPIATNHSAASTAGQASSSSSSSSSIGSSQSDDANSKPAPSPSKSFKIKDGMAYVPWSENENVIKFTFYVEGSSQSNPDELIGYASIKVKDLMPSDFNDDGAVESAVLPEVKKWITLSINETNLNYQPAVSATASASVSSSQNRGDIGPFSMAASVVKPKQVLLRLQLDVRNSSQSKMNLESSISLQSILSQRESLGSGASTISTLWNMRDNVKYVQNLMNDILDYIESMKNLVNWTNPKKTMPIYIAVVLLWITTMFIKGRYLILLAGLLQFFYKYLPNADSTQVSDAFHNMMQSVPNDDDLDSIYSEERRLNIESRLKVQENRIKDGVLNILLQCKFRDQVWIKVVSTTTMSSVTSSLHQGGVSSLFKHGSNSSAATASKISSSGHAANEASFITLSDKTSIPVPSPDWMNVFVVLQERRFVWWKCEADILEGRPPLGQLLFHGPGIGATQVSPIDVRDMQNEVGRLIAIVGCDERSDPLKCTLLCSNSAKCLEFKDIIKALA